MYLYVGLCQKDETHANVLHLSPYGLFHQAANEGAHCQLSSELQTRFPLLHCLQMDLTSLYGPHPRFEEGIEQTVPSLRQGSVTRLLAAASVVHHGYLPNGTKFVIANFKSKLSSFGNNGITICQQLLKWACFTSKAQ